MGIFPPILEKMKWMIEIDLTSVCFVKRKQRIFVVFELLLENGFEATIKDILMTTKTVDSAVWEKKISLEASVCLLQVSKCFELSCQIALGISQMYIWLKVNWKKADSKRPWKWCAFYFVITKTPQNNNSLNIKSVGRYFTK